MSFKIVWLFKIYVQDLEQEVLGPRTDLSVIY